MHEKKKTYHSFSVFQINNFMSSFSHYFYSNYLINLDLLNEMKNLSIELTDEEKINSYKHLSEEEILQLKIGREENYVSYEEWPFIRKILLKKSIKSNPLTNPELCAYTPGETRHLLNHPIVQNYHSEIKKFIIPEKYETIILVPCAKSKPWLNCRKGSLYPSYNKIKEENDKVYFVTISEPLAIVPQDFWASFPQYDNPGLFKDPAMRSGFFAKDWKNILDSNRSLKTPFSFSEYAYCIKELGGVIKEFFQTNHSRKVISFLEDFKGKGTHSEMIDFANIVKPENRFYKREKPRTPPLEYIKKNIR